MYLSFRMSTFLLVYVCTMAMGYLQGKAGDLIRELLQGHVLSIPIYPVLQGFSDSKQGT